MIKINGVEYVHSVFPDKTPMMLNFSKQTYNIKNDGENIITWLYNNDAELCLIQFIVMHIREHFNNDNIALILPYIPNARMDRVKSESEVFTLKYFTKIINSLNFKRVCVFDAHSNVSLGLIDRVQQYDIKIFQNMAISSIKQQMGVNDEELVVYFPDDGAMGRYGNGFQYPLYYGKKHRDWKSGKIINLTIHETETQLSELKNKTIIMVDDIVSYGGTMYHSAMELSKYNPKNIVVMTSHLENEAMNGERSKILKALDNSLITKVYTTNSLFNQEHNKVDVIKIF